MLELIVIGPIIFIGNVPDLDEENEMTELRKRMNDAMVLRGLAERTKESYLACVTGPVSYTHLDVYKRQVLSGCSSVISARGRKSSLANFFVRSRFAGLPHRHMMTARRSGEDVLNFCCLITSASAAECAAHGSVFVWLVFPAEKAQTWP